MEYNLLAGGMKLLGRCSFFDDESALVIFMCILFHWNLGFISGLGLQGVASEFCADGRRTSLPFDYPQSGI